MTRQPQPAEDNPSSDDAADEDLVAELRLAGQLDPVPHEIVATVKAAFIWRTIDTELAELIYDSALDDDALVAVRGAGEATRRLTFESPTFTVEVEVEALDRQRRLQCQLVPAQPGHVEVRHGSGTVAVDTDAMGRFSVDGVPPGPISLECRGSDATTSVTTDWVLL